MAGFLVTSVSVGAGLAVYAIFESCDPVYSGNIEKIDQIVPYATLHLFKNLLGMTGLFAGAVFCATLR